MAGASVVPDVVSGLIARFTSAAVQDLHVADGPVYDTDVSFVSVGWDRADSPGVVVTRMPDSAGFSESEQIEVACLLSYTYGSDDLATVRGWLFDAFDALGAALAADRRLGGAVMTSRIATYSLDLEPIAGQSIAELAFTVVARASGL